MTIQAFQTCAVQQSVSTFHAMAQKCPSSFQIREKHPAFIAGEYLVRPLIDRISSAFSWLNRVTSLPGAAAEKVEEEDMNTVTPDLAHHLIQSQIENLFLVGNRFDNRYQNIFGVENGDRDLATEALSELTEIPTNTNTLLGLMHTQVRRVMKLFLKINDVCSKNMTLACQNGMENLRRLNVILHKQEVHLSELHQGPSIGEWLFNGIVNSLREIWSGIKNSDRHDF